LKQKLNLELVSAKRNNFIYRKTHLTHHNTSDKQNRIYKKKMWSIYIVRDYPNIYIFFFFFPFFVPFFHSRFSFYMFSSLSLLESSYLFFSLLKCLCPIGQILFSFLISIWSFFFV